MNEREVSVDAPGKQSRWCSARQSDLRLPRDYCLLRTFRRCVELWVQRPDARLRLLALSFQAGDQGLLTSDGFARSFSTALMPVLARTQLLPERGLVSNLLPAACHRVWATPAVETGPPLTAGDG